MSADGCTSIKNGVPIRSVLAVIKQLVLLIFVCAGGYFVRNAIDNKFDDNGKYDLNKKLRILLSISTTIILWMIVPDVHDQISAVLSVAYWFFPGCVSVKMILFYDKQKRAKQTLIQYLWEIFWFMWLPGVLVYKNDDKAKPAKSFTVYNIIHHLVTHSIPLLLYLYGTTICAYCIETYLLKCLSNQEKVALILDKYLFLSFYCWLVTLMVILLILPSSAIAIDTVISLLTLNRYKVMYLNNYPLTALSIKELWNKRYNVWIRIFLRENIFAPLVSFGTSKSFAAFCAFLFSGVFHAWMSWKWYNNLYWTLSTLAFFILHAFATILESFIFRKNRAHKNRSISFVEMSLRYTWTLSFFIFSMPIFCGALVEHFDTHFRLRAVLRCINMPIPYENVLVNYVESYQCLYPQNQAM